MKKSGKYQYLQIVENHREGKKTIQRVIGTIGRMDRLKEKGEVDKLIHSLSKYSEKVMLVLSGRSDVTARSKKIGPSLIFDRLWKELSIKKVIRKLLAGRKFGFNVERAIYLTVLHRLFVSGSDRSCDRWRRDYRIDGVANLSLHHIYRAMAWVGESLVEQDGATPFAPRCNKDMIEEGIFFENRDLFTGLDVVFFDTTSIYFEGAGGESLGHRGKSKDHRPDLNQMVVGVVLDDKGSPICCEMWPGNTADVKTLIPITDRIRNRFNVGRFCVVADRGMISKETIKELEDPQMDIPYILGVRMRNVKEAKEDVLSRSGRYKEVYPETRDRKEPSPLKVKEVMVNGRRYIVCLNTKEARKDAATRQAIVEGLKRKLKKDAKALIGNKGYRKYVKMERDSVNINFEKIEAEKRFDGKWVLQTNTDLSAKDVALKYKQLWEVELAFRDIKSVLETRPVFHQRDETIRGHVFCSFLALILRKELFRRLEKSGHSFQWADIKQDLKALQETIIKEKGKSLGVRSKCLGTCGKIFQSVGVAIPPTIREL
ncbi:MAG: IS1634 family transposase [Thermodesulfobacteriota bacterium]|nr:IS1634 family transposase [Thermodesulfobacteriota bacterium]